MARPCLPWRCPRVAPFGPPATSPLWSLSGQCTKSLRSSPLRGSKSREAGSQVRGQRWRAGKVNTISSCIVGVQRMIKNS
jgi:hypothetical protein